MEWYQLMLLVIDMRSFSSLWYWIGLAVLWSSVGHWALGVPYDLMQRALRHGGAAKHDLWLLAQIHARRLTYIGNTAGVLITALSCFALSVLAPLAVIYDIELAQAVILMALPIMIVAGLSFRLAYRVVAQAPDAAATMSLLARHRIWVKTIGMVAIFVTALFGMYQNFL